MPRTQGQALLNFAIMDRNERDRLESQQRKQQRKLKKRGRRAGFFGGLGKLVGGVAGNLIAPGVGGAIGASLLGRLGGEVGKKSVGGGRANVGDGFLLNKLAAKDINRGLRSQEQDFERSRQGGMLSDAAFGYSMGKGFEGLFESAGKGLAKDPMSTLKTLMGQTQGQGLQQVGQVAQMPGMPQQFGGMIQQQFNPDNSVLDWLGQSQNINQFRNMGAF